MCFNIVEIEWIVKRINKFMVNFNKLIMFLLIQLFFFCFIARTVRNETGDHSVRFIDGISNKILLVDGHKFYKRRTSKSTIDWTCRLSKSLGWTELIPDKYELVNKFLLFLLFLRCMARCKSNIDGQFLRFINLNHNHGVNTNTLNSNSKNPSVFIPPRVKKEQ